MAQGVSAANATTQALAGIYADLQQQALMLSYLDVFRIMMYGCLVVLTLVMFLRNVRKGEKVAVGH